MFWQFYLGFALITHSCVLLAVEELAPVDVTTTKELSKFQLGSHERIDLSNSSTPLLNEAIEDVPGIISTQDGGPGSRTSFFIRGTEARHVSFTIDGLKINDPSNTDRQYDAAFLTTPFLREVILYKGPEAVLFGSDALGGLVDMRTRKGEEAPVTRLGFSVGSFGTASTSLSKDWQGGGHKGTLTWSSFRTDGISRLNEKRFSARERDGSEVTQLTSSSSHPWSSKGETDLLVSFLRGKNELDGFMDDNSHDEGRGDQYLLQQQTRYELSTSSDLSIRNGISRHQRNLDTLAVGKNSFEGDLIQNELLYRMDTGVLKFLGGMATEKEVFDQKGRDESTELHSVFIQSSLRNGPLDLQAGIRSDHHGLYGNYHTGSTGIALGLQDQVFALNFSQGLKAPSLYQLYGEPIFGNAIGNKDLKPERSNSLEARWTNQMLELAIFRNSLSSLITFTSQGYRNQENFVAQGIEFGADIKDESFRMKPSLTIQQFKENSRPILRRPTRSLGLDASWFPRETLELFAKIRTFNERMDHDEQGNVVKLKGFETVTVGAKLSWGSSVVGLQLVNVMNREYEEVYGYSVMPRSVFLNYGIEL